MFRFEWEDSYNTGINKLDDQHRNLLKVMNDLHLSMVQGKGRSKVAGFLDNLISVAKPHFSFEEKYLLHAGYPGLALQQKQHKEFMEKIQEFQKEAVDPSISLPVIVMDYLKGWFQRHVVGEDHKYAEFLANK